MLHRPRPLLTAFLPFSALAFAFALVLVLVLGACARPTVAPPRSESLVVGKGHAPASPGPAPSAAVASEDDAAIPIGAGDPVRGSREAYVTIVVFSDFECPFCSRLVPTLDRLAEELGREQLRLVFKNNPLPFHPHARLAAEIGQGVLATAGHEAFFRYHDLVFKNQRDMEEEALVAFAAEAGANAAEITRGVVDKLWAAKVDADMDLAKRLGAYGTPMSYVNGVAVSGAQPYEKFKEVATAELANAKSLAERGVSRDKLYARLVAANLKDDAARHEDDERDRDRQQKEREERDREAAKVVHKIPVGASPARGPQGALVTIVQFSDFQCPFCKKVEPTLEQLRNHYGDKLRIVWKDQPLPFHARAEPAAELARAARAQKGDAGFWLVHDLLFENQSSLEDTDLERIAAKAKLDTQKAMAQVKAKAFAKAIATDAELADDFQASGTPHFFVNGRRLAGAQPFDKFKAIVDEEITKAEALLKAGTPRASLYDALTKNGKPPAEPERRAVDPPPATAPFRGAATAKVVIQEFADLQCPFCARVESTLEELLKAYPGKIKIVWRDHPLSFHKDAALAAEAAREAYAQKGNEGFFKMQKLIFANQAALKQAHLEAYAAQAGLDAAKMKKALDGRIHQGLVQADEQVASSAGVSGTPSFFIGPFFISGAQPLSKLKKLVDRALAEPAAPPPGAARTLAGGLVVKDVVVGAGREAKAGDKLRVHYVGTLTDGKPFDSSRTRGQPFEFELGKGLVIKGWDQGLVGMRAGGRRKLTIPPDLAYGERGHPPTIPSKATLVFDVELLSIQ